MIILNAQIIFNSLKCNDWLHLCIVHFVCQIAAILTLPFDVVKTRRQIQLGEMDTLGGLYLYLYLCYSMWNVFTCVCSMF